MRRATRRTPDKPVRGCYTHAYSGLTEADNLETKCIIHDTPPLPADSRVRAWEGRHGAVAAALPGAGSAVLLCY
jgi:hypothetical protein